MIEIFDCSYCGTGVSNRVNSNEVDVNALENYRFNSLAEKLFTGLKCLRVLSILLKLKTVPDQVLDWGCGRGDVLETFRTFGSSVCGVEYDLKTASDAKSRKIPVYISSEGGVPALKQSGDRYNLVATFHFLEHIENPEEVLLDIRDLLAPAGVLIAEVPNYSSYQKLITGNFWMGYDTLNHFYHFTPSSFEKLLNKAGFQVFSKSFFSLEYGLPMFFFSMVDKVMKKSNYLFSVFDKDIALERNTKSKGLNYVLSVFVILFAILISPILLIIELFQSIHQRGGVIRYYAKISCF